MGRLCLLRRVGQQSPVANVPETNAMCYRRLINQGCTAHVHMCNHCIISNQSSAVFMAKPATGRHVACWWRLYRTASCSGMPAILGNFVTISIVRGTALLNKAQVQVAHRANQLA